MVLIDFQRDEENITEYVSHLPKDCSNWNFIQKLWDICIRYNDKYDDTTDVNFNISIYPFIEIQTYQLGELLNVTDVSKTWKA